MARPSQCVRQVEYGVQAVLQMGESRPQKGAQHQAIRRSRGGLTAKIVGMVDALGNLFRFLLLPGQAHDMKGVAPLIRNVPFGALLADKAFNLNSAV